MSVEGAARVKACGRKWQEARRLEQREQREQKAGRWERRWGRYQGRGHWSWVHCEDVGFLENTMGSTVEQGSGMMGLHTCESPRRSGLVSNPLPRAWHQIRTQ